VPELEPHQNFYTEQEPHKNDVAPQHCFLKQIFIKKISEKSWPTIYLGQDPDLEPDPDVFESRIQSKIVKKHCIQGINKYNNLTMCVLRLRLLITYRYFTETTDN
jgi:hypothetical protein